MKKREANILSKQNFSEHKIFYVAVIITWIIENKHNL